jgi:hypothetical protein
MRPITTLVFVSAFALAAHAQEKNLLSNGGFELPKVEGRKANLEGGNPALAPQDASLWRHFQVLGKAPESEGAIHIGLTNEIARTGRQSLFVDFSKYKSTKRRAQLLSDVFEVDPARDYIISIWGRTDPKRPLTLDQRRPYMQLEIEFFMIDPGYQSGELQHRTQMIPGSPGKLLFTSNQWNRYEARVRSPRDAAFMKITFRWETGREAGETDGVIYFDDAEVTLDPEGGSLVPVKRSELIPPKPEPDDAASGDGN